jgi:hypothetical protein
VNFGELGIRRDGNSANWEFGELGIRRDGNSANWEFGEMGIRRGGNTPSTQTVRTRLLTWLNPQ